MKREYIIAACSMGAVLIASIGTVATWIHLHPEPLVVQGEVDATQVDIAAKISARVLELKVKKGDQVQKGQILVLLDSPELRAKLQQAGAAERAAMAQQLKAYNGTREEDIRAAQSAWQRAVASADLADKTHQRIARLHADGVVPKQKLDEAEAQQQMARKAVEGARASYDMALRGARQEDKMASSAIAQQASNVTAEVSAVERETVLKAPMAGEITEINVDPGELASTGYPIVSIIDLNDIWVTFNIREDILAGLQIGDTIPAILPSQGNRTIALKVDYIKALGDFARWNATKTSGEFDMKTFEVHARPTERINGLRPGMSVIVHWSRHQQKGKKVPPHVRANP